MPRHIILKLQDIKNREKLLEASRRRADAPRELEADFPAASVEVREAVPSRCWKTHQPRILDSGKIARGNHGWFS